MQEAWDSVIEKKEKREDRARVRPLQVSMQLHSVKKEPSEIGAGDKVSSAKKSRISSEILTASKKQKTSNTLQSCHSVYAKSDKATKEKCSVDQQAQG